MGLVNYQCENCNKLLGFVIRDDIPFLGEVCVKIKGSCCNKI